MLTPVSVKIKVSFALMMFFYGLFWAILVLQETSDEPRTVAAPVTIPAEPESGTIPDSRGPHWQIPRLAGLRGLSHGTYSRRSRMDAYSVDVRERVFQALTRARFTRASADMPRPRSCETVSPGRPATSRALCQHNKVRMHAANAGQPHTPDGGGDDSLPARPSPTHARRCHSRSPKD